MVSQPMVARFFRDCYEDFANCGIARLFALQVGGRMIAFDLGYVMDGIYSSCKISYLPEYHRCSPGVVLTRRCWSTFHAIEASLLLTVSAKSMKQLCGGHIEDILLGASPSPPEPWLVTSMCT